ncbi:hypothetical protein D3C85_422800 [compost metagenome]
MLERLPCVALLAAALHAAPALSACGPADAGFAAPGTLAATPVSVDLSHERVLLGRHGERVPTRPAPVWAEDKGDLLPRTWMDKVDWSAYRVDGGANGGASGGADGGTDGGVDGGRAVAPTRLYFDPDGRLCRIERYDRPARGGRAPQPAGGFALEYDARGALLRVAEYEQAPGATYAMVGQTCLKRDAQGALIEFIADRCGNAQDPAGSRRFVRDAAGALLRVIDTTALGEPVAVQTYDGNGRPRQRYVRQYSPYAAAGESSASLPYAEPAPQRDRLHILEREGLSRLSAEVPGNEWRIVRIADDVPLDDSDLESWDPQTQTVLAQGLTGPLGQAPLKPDEQERIWKAMHDKPGRILWYVDPMSRVLLVPAMAPAAWQACTDPANLTGQACP